MPRRIDFDALDRKYPAMERVQSRYLSRVPGVVLLSGHTGSGKSVLAISIIQKMRREGSLTRCFVLSPTARSNAIYGAICTDEERDWKIDLDPKTVFADVKRVEDACEADAQQFREDLEYKLARDKYCAGDSLTMAEEHLLEARGYVEVQPKRPSPALFVDDAVSSPLYSNSNRNYFTQLLIRCRHVGEGTGLSIFMATQGIRMIPRPIRLNATNWMVWRTSSAIEKRVLFEEVAAAFMGEHEFYRQFDLLTHMPYAYMHIDCIARTVSDTF